MPRGVTLGVLVNELRIEAGHVSNPSLTKNYHDLYVQTLKRTQRRLWMDYAWPHLRIKRDILSAAGQRYYNVPDELPTYRIEHVQFKWGDVWNWLDYRINPRHDYTIFDSDRGETNWPLQKWDVVEDVDATGGNPDDVGVVEFWPIPSVNSDPETLEGNVRLTGTRRIAEMVEDSDPCELESDLLVLYAAAEIQARNQNPMAQATLLEARQLFDKLKVRSSHKKAFSMIGPERTERYVIGPPWPRRTISQS